MAQEQKVILAVLLYDTKYFVFQEDGKWMYTGGEDCTARIWDPR